MKSCRPVFESILNETIDSKSVATTQASLKTYVESIHDGVKYPCNQCVHKATTQSDLKRHIKSVHDGLKYPLSQCDYKATQHTHLKRR